MTVAEATAASSPIININDVRHDFIVPVIVKERTVEFTLDDDTSASSLLTILRSLPATDTDVHREIRRRIAVHRHAPLEVLETLSTDRQAWVRRAVANHKNTTQSLLTALAKDASVDVRVAVAQNWNTPVGVLRVLAEDEATMVRSWAVEHPEMSTEILLRSLNEKSPVVYRKVLEELVRRAYPEANLPETV